MSSKLTGQERRRCGTRAYSVRPTELPTILLGVDSLTGASLQCTLPANAPHSTVRGPHDYVLKTVERHPWSHPRTSHRTNWRNSYNDGSSRRLFLRESNSRIGAQRGILSPSLATGAAPRVSHVKPRPRSVARPPTPPHGAHAPLLR